MRDTVTVVAVSRADVGVGLLSRSNKKVYKGMIKAFPILHKVESVPFKTERVTEHFGLRASFSPPRPRYWRDLSAHYSLTAS